MAAELFEVVHEQWYRVGPRPVAGCCGRSLAVRSRRLR
jgi:hypothetical protein